MNIPNMHNLFILLLMDLQLFLFFHYYDKVTTFVYISLVDVHSPFS